MTVQLQRPEASRRLNGGDRGFLARLAVMSEQLVDVDIADAIPVSQAERIIQIRPDARNAPTCLSVLARVNQRHLPRFCRSLVYLHLVCGHVKGHI